MVRRPDIGYWDEGLDLADPANYVGATLPFGTAYRLPAVAHRSLQFAYLEDEAVWTRDWVAVGTAADLPEEGDLLPFTLGYHGIHIQRISGGGLEGRFNMAQHGGCRIVPTQCQNGTKTKCSFTSCGYSRDRKPISIAKEGGNTAAMYQYLGLRPERLYPVQTFTLGSVVFANVDPEGHAPRWKDDVALPEALQAGQATRTAEQWFEFDANWKIAGQSLAFVEEETYADRHILEGWRRMADGGRIDVRWLFPNLVILSKGDEACVVVIQQTALGKTLFRTQVFVADGGLASDPQAWFTLVKAAGERSEAVQQAVAAQPAANNGLSAGEADGSQDVQTDLSGWWLQRALIDRLATMPKVESDVPMYKPVGNYLI